MFFPRPKAKDSPPDHDTHCLIMEITDGDNHTLQLELERLQDLNIGGGLSWDDFKVQLWAFTTTHFAPILN